MRIYKLQIRTIKQITHVSIFLEFDYKIQDINKITN